MSMNRKLIGISVGVGLAAVAAGGLAYRALVNVRRRREIGDDDSRLTVWEAEGGALRSDPARNAGDWAGRARSVPAGGS